LTLADLKPESARRNILPFTKAAKKKPKTEPSKSTRALEKLLAECEADPDCHRGVERYAKHLGLPFQTLWDLGCRWKRIEVYPKNPLNLPNEREVGRYPAVIAEPAPSARRGGSPRSRGVAVNSARAGEA